MENDGDDKNHQIDNCEEVRNVNVPDEIIRRKMKKFIITKERYNEDDNYESK